MAAMRLHIVSLTSATPATSPVRIWANFHPLRLGAPFSIPGGLTADPVLYLCPSGLTSRSNSSPVSKEASGFFLLLPPIESHTVQGNNSTGPGDARGADAVAVRPRKQWLLLPAVGLAWIHLGTHGGGQAVSHQDTQAGSCHRTAAHCGFAAQASLDSTLFQALFSPQSASTNHWQ